MTEPNDKAESAGKDLIAKHSNEDEDDNPHDMIMFNLLNMLNIDGDSSEDNCFR
jgi:hypothetical protein